MKSPGPAGWATRAGQFALAAMGAGVLLALIQRMSGSPANGVLGSAVVLAVWTAIVTGLIWLAGRLSHWFGRGG